MEYLAGSINFERLHVYDDYRHLRHKSIDTVTLIYKQGH